MVLVLYLICCFVCVFMLVDGNSGDILSFELMEQRDYIITLCIGCFDSLCFDDCLVILLCC